jgi:hypothetical protein
MVVLPHVNPNVSTFGVFGSLSWTLILDEKIKEPTIDICWLGI